MSDEVQLDSAAPSSARAVITIALVALLFRGFVCFRELDQYAADPDAYKMIAQTLGTKGVFGTTASTGEAVPTAFRPPLYPYLLSWLVVDGRVSLYSIAAFHAALGCITAICTFLASRRLLPGSNSAAGIVAAMIVIVDPILLQQSTLAMTETLATALASAVLWWWARGATHGVNFSWAIVFGLMLSLAYLCRPTFLVWGVAMVLCAALARPVMGRSWKQRAVRAAVVAVILLVTVGLWTLRNARAIGHPVWATTHGGYTLLLGNNPMFYQYLRTGEWGTTWDAGPYLNAYSHRYEGDPSTAEFWQREWSNPLTDSTATGASPQFTEHEDDRRSYEAAKATIGRQPHMFVWSSLVRIYRLWTPLPHRTRGRSAVAVVAVGVYYTVFYVAVAFGSWRLELLKLWRVVHHPRWWASAALVLTLTTVHAVYWSNMRMRAPAIPVLAVLAAAAIRIPRPVDV